MDFGELRSLLAQAPSAGGWARLWRMLESLDTAQQAELVPYVEGHLMRWPDALRLAPEHWAQRAFYDEAVPLWPLARTASLTRWGLYDTELIALSRSAAMQSLTRLALDRNQLGEDGMRALAQSERAAGLTALSVRDNPLGPSGARGLAQVANLTALDMGYTRSSSRGLRHVLRGKSAASLEALRADHCEVGDEVISQLVGLERLTTLSLASNRVTAQGAQQLAAQADGCALTELELSENALGDEGARWLAACAERSGVTALTVAACGMGAAGLRHLLGAAERGELRALDMSRNRLGNASSGVFAELTALKLERLVLQACGLGWPAVVALADCAALRGLRELDLSYNTIDLNGALALATSPQLGALERLVLADCGLGQAGVMALAESPHLACRQAVGRA